MTSLITSLARNPFAGRQMTFLQTALPVDVSAQSAANGDIRAGRMRVDAPFKVTNLSYMVGTASGNINLGVYVANAALDAFTLVASTASTAAAGASAIQTIALSAPYWLVPGVDYYFAFQADNNTITVYRTSGTVGFAIGAQSMYKSGLTYNLATNGTSITGANTTNQPLPWIAAT